MQFTFATVAIVLAAIASTNAAPGASVIAQAEIQKRTCGTLTGTALTVCQDACKAVCDTVTVGLVQTLCNEACSIGPLKERSVLTTICDGACDVACNSTILALDQTLCLSKCKAIC